MTALLGGVVGGVGSCETLRLVVADYPHELARLFDRPRTMEPESEPLSEWHDTRFPCMDELIELSRSNAIPANLIFDGDSFDSAVPNSSGLSTRLAI